MCSACIGDSIGRYNVRFDLGVAVGELWRNLAESVADALFGGTEPWNQSDGFVVLRQALFGPDSGASLILAVQVLCHTGKDLFDLLGLCVSRNVDLNVDVKRWLGSMRRAGSELTFGFAGQFLGRCVFGPLRPGLSRPSGTLVVRGLAARVRTFPWISGSTLT